MTQTLRFTPDPEAIKEAMRGRYDDFYGQFTPLKGRGKERRGPCPLHGGDGPNFAVNTDTGEWYCHSQCDEGGDVITFTRRHLGLSFHDALRRLADEAGLTQTDPPAHPRKEPIRLLGPITDTYDYTDQNGDLLFQTTRHVPRLNATAHAHYRAAVLAVLALDPPPPDSDQGRRHPLRLIGDAAAAWAEAAQNVEERQRDGRDLAGMRDWASKLAGHAARMAALFHLIERVETGDRTPWQTPISAACVRAAWEWGRYFIGHAKAAHGSMQTEGASALARRVLTWIVREGKAEFSRRDCHRAHQNLTGVNSSEDIKAALDVLADRGYIRERRDTGRGATGRPRTPVYEVNPLVTKVTEATEPVN